MIWFIDVDPCKEVPKLKIGGKTASNRKIFSFSRWDSKEIIDIFHYS
jgi:hypothetical protein